jgi:creatinine amidohydrolase/Fe(II)-dependent formamide hydrolase-like protein
MRDERFLPNLTWHEIRDLEKINGVLVLPIGAIEQHGPQLPTFTDALIAERMTMLALERLKPETRVWRLPTQSYGKSNEHAGYPGTFALSASTLMAVVRDIALGAKLAGFRRLAFVNAHGGNTALLSMMARDIRVETGLMVFTLFSSAGAQDPIEITPEEVKFGIHAGDWETSIVMALEPELVHMDRAVKSFPDYPASQNLSLTQGNAVSAWLTRDWSPTGVFGDSTVATVAKGQARLEACVVKLAEVLTEISTFEIPGVVDG